ISNDEISVPFVKQPDGDWKHEDVNGNIEFTTVQMSTGAKTGNTVITKLPSDEELPESTGLKSMAGQDLNIGDWVTNKTGSKIGKIVSVDVANQKVGFLNHDISGSPMYKKDGSPFISNYSPENLVHTKAIETATVSDDGEVVDTPKPTVKVGQPVSSPSSMFTNSHPEVIYSEGDPSHPLYGTPKPELPEDPSATEGDFKYVP